MTTANITRPICTENFTTLPNFLFDFNRYIKNLKPRDSAVLNYLLTKPATWKLRAQDIATAINVCERTVYKALRILQDLGFARYERESSGRTNWFIAIPDTVQIPVKSPHSKKSDGILPHGKIAPVLTKNEKSLENTEQSLTKKENTTTDVPKISPESTAVVAVETVEIDIAEFTPQQKIIAQKSLSKVPSLTIQKMILMMLKIALTKSDVKSPLAYLNALINKSIAGELDMSHAVELQKQTTKPLSRNEKITRLFEKHRDKITIELLEKGFIFLDGEGSIFKSEFEKLGLITKVTNTMAV
jgi:DNA-binding transcriptional regulator GbsR (MarR family)